MDANGFFFDIVGHTTNVEGMNTLEYPINLTSTIAPILDASSQMLYLHLDGLFYDR